MDKRENPSWVSIHYRAGTDGTPCDTATRTDVLGIIEQGFTHSAEASLTKVSETVAVEVNSQPPSEGASTTSDGDEETWEDVEPDVETVTYKSLVDEKTFGSLAEMCNYDREAFNIDLRSIRNDLGLDFYESVKLVNFLRHQAANGVIKTTIPQSKDAFASEEYLKPVLEDDAVLFSLDELDNQDDQGHSTQQRPDQGPSGSDAQKLQEYMARIAELEMALEMTRRKFLDERSADEHNNPSVPRGADERQVHDRSYFDSYAARGIHEEMLKDTARTDAYRDFIYDNKHLFEGKVVLDVGCGTGILSLMCAKAGAKHVFAVDNSGIIDQAREIAFVNGLQDTVTCMRGMVEEVTLPVEKVDIIVSEWMGYALLYEAMLDSVIFARDKWLRADGLMIPSQISLHMALLADPELIVDKSDYWADVYGFDMSVMSKGVFEGALVEVASTSAIPSDLSTETGSSKVLDLDLHQAAVAALTFRESFELKLDREIDALDGFVVWFDTRFGRAETNHNIVVLSTGPLARRTHWQQVKLVIDRGGRLGERLSPGEAVRGSIEYSRPAKEHRNLEIIIQWHVEGRQEKGAQHWKIDY